jgi:predicted nucleic acid-binding protein
MILVDTSVWVDHLRGKDALLEEKLLAAQVVLHPFIIGELALGQLKIRAEILRLLQGMPQAIVANAHEVLQFIDNKKLFGMGIGYIDVHLLCSAVLMPDTRIWTRDKALRALASQMGVAFDE